MEFRPRPAAFTPSGDRRRNTPGHRHFAGKGRMSDWKVTAHTMLGFHKVRETALDYIPVVFRLAALAGRLMAKRHAERAARARLEGKDLGRHALGREPLSEGSRIHEGAVDGAGRGADEARFAIDFAGRLPFMAATRCETIPRATSQSGSWGHGRGRIVS